MRLKTILNESNIFRSKDTVSNTQWNTFRTKYLNQFPTTSLIKDTKNNVEYIVDKKDKKNAILKYDMNDLRLYHDMKPSEFIKFIR
jgi:hypothetical protein